MNKKLIVVGVILLVLIIGAFFYFGHHKDKCSSVVCSSNQKCDIVSGKCKPPVVNSNLVGMDKIEQAIEAKLSK